MRLPYTVRVFGGSWKISRALLTAMATVVGISAAIQPVAMRDFAGCTEQAVLCVLGFWAAFVLLGAFAFYLSILIGALIVDVVVGVLRTVLGWVRTPQPGNLRLSIVGLRGSVYVLRFRSTEWRYLRSPIEHTISMQPFVLRLGDSVSDAYFAWQDPSPGVRKALGRFTPVQFDLLEIDDREDRFWIKAPGNDQLKFPPGKYAFNIRLGMRTHRPVRIKRTFTLASTATWQDVQLLVAYEGGRQISVEVVDFPQFKQYIWSRQLSNVELQRSLAMPPREKWPPDDTSHLGHIAN